MGPFFFFYQASILVYGWHNLQNMNSLPGSIYISQLMHTTVFKEVTKYFYGDEV